MGTDKIIVKGARVNNLANLDVEIPRDRFVVITGISGSGKSSLAFDTIYAEGQRRYVESLSAYARQFLEQLGKPDVDSIDGLSPAISIEQKTTSRNPRSTVGTITEIYDYLRVLYARAGDVHCPTCDKPIAAQTVQQIVDRVTTFGEGTKIHVLAPVVRGRKGEYRKDLQRYRKEGFARVKVDGVVHMLEDEIPLDKKRNHTIDLFVDRLVVKDGIERRLTDSVEIALKLAEGLVKVEEVDGGREHMFSERFACIDCGFSLPELSPRIFSFNNPHGACPSCDGLGYKMEFDPEMVVPNPNLSIREGAIIPWENRNSVYFAQTLESLEKHFEFSIYTPWKKLPADVKKALLFGSEDEVKFFYEQGERRYEYAKAYEGVIGNLRRRHAETQSETIREELRRFMSVIPCPACEGARLRVESLAVTIGGRTISNVTDLPVRDAAAFFRDLKLDDQRTEIARRLLKEINERLGFLEAVGLEYLTLGRAGATLSGGESQRIRLATQVGSSLVGVLYILDEPSIGLHQRDNDRLLRMLRRLRDLGNTVLVVEHDAETILSADYVLDLGPGAGVHGGRLVCAGTPQQIMDCPDSLTGDYLSGRREIPVPKQRRIPDKRWIEIKGATQNNLLAVDARFPIGAFTCVTGVSGSGKSTLVIDTLYRALMQRLHHSKERAGAHLEIRGLHHLDKVIDIDQSPIGRTPRSNPATYTGLFSPIRDLFAELPESRVRGYKPGRFSFNVKGGRCEACQGDGLIKVEMHFLPDVYVVCDQCGGKRYNRDTLDITYRNHSVADVLDMNIDEATELFANFPAIVDKLRMLQEVGLGYLPLGLQATKLSGGEAQRIKLAKELAKRATGRTLYILDEPTTGLHFDDIAKLLTVLQRLAETGNTVIVIEHNLDVIKTADYIVDLGPEGGDMGGRVVAVGSPEEVAENAASFTGQFLKKVLPTASRKPKRQTG